MQARHNKVARTLAQCLFGLTGMSLVAGCSLFAGGASELPIIEDVQWAVKDIDGQQLVENSVVTLNFASDGKVTGKASCNGYTGAFERVDQQLSVSRLIQTKRLCRPASVMEQEQRFTALLQDVQSWEINQQGELRLLTATGQSMTASRQLD